MFEIKESFLSSWVLFDFLDFVNEINLIFNNEWNKERVLYKEKEPLPFFSTPKSLKVGGVAGVGGQHQGNLIMDRSSGLTGSTPSI